MTPPANLEQLIYKIAADVGATEAAAFSITQPDFFDGRRIETLMHVRPDTESGAVSAAAIAAFKEILTPCVQQAKDGAIQIEESGNKHGKQFCLIALAHHEENVVGAASFIVRCQDTREAAAKLMRVQRAASGL